MLRSHKPWLQTIAVVLVSSLCVLGSVHTEALALDTPRLACNLKYLRVRYSTAGLPAAVKNVMQAAINYYNCRFTNNVNVNIDVRWESLPTGILGQAQRNTITVPYSVFRRALLLRRPNSLEYGTKFADVLKYSNLTYLLGARGPIGYSIRLNDTVQITRANAKALGLLAANDEGVDSTITFSAGWPWTYTLYSGVAGRYSLFATAVHEIGHTLGFVSDIDNPTGTPTPLDLFRFSDVSLATGRPSIPWLADSRQPGCGDEKFFLSGLISLSPGKQCILQGGCNRRVELERGSQCGSQASHWRDNLSIGIMDPTLGAGEWNVLSSNDMELFYHLGWNPVNMRILEKPTGLPSRSTRDCGDPNARCAALP